MYRHASVSISFAVHNSLTCAALPKKVVSAVPCRITRSSACCASLLPRRVHECHHQDLPKTALPSRLPRFTRPLLMVIVLLLGRLVFVVCTIFPPPGLHHERLQPSNVNLISTILIPTLSEALSTQQETWPFLVSGSLHAWEEGSTVLTAFGQRRGSLEVTPASQQGHLRRGEWLFRWLLPERTQTRRIRGFDRDAVQQKQDYPADSRLATALSSTNKRSSDVHTCTWTAWKVCRPHKRGPRSSSTVHRGKGAYLRTLQCTHDSCRTLLLPFQPDKRWRPRDAVSGSLPSAPRSTKAEGRVCAPERREARDGGVPRGRYTCASAKLLLTKPLHIGETLTRLCFVPERMLQSVPLLRRSSFSPTRRCNEMCDQSPTRPSTRLHMARSRSKPIHREAHPGLKQLILREKFWMRFDPAKNKLLHTPEYTALLIRDNQHLTPGKSSEEVQFEPTSGVSSQNDRNGERVELSAEQRAALHAREVAYRRQQPRFRMKRWGSGRWKKEQAYVLRLLASHRQKMLQHELRKARRSKEFAERLRWANETCSPNAGPEGPTGAGEWTCTSASYGEEGNDQQHQQTSVEAKAASLSYSFIYKEVVPRLAALEQIQQQEALAQWKSCERHRELQQRVRIQQQAQRLAKTEGDLYAGDDWSAQRANDVLQPSCELTLLEQLRGMPQKKKMHMQEPSQVLSLPEQQQLFLGHFGALRESFAAKKQLSDAKTSCGREQLRLLRRISIYTRQAYLQFLADIHFIFTSFEELLTDGVEALLKEPQSQDLAGEHVGSQEGLQTTQQSETQALGPSGLPEGISPLPVPSESIQAKRRNPQTMARRPEWRTTENLEEFVSCLSFQKGTKSGDDLVAICELLKRSPPSPSESAEAFLVFIAGLQQKDFVRALSRIYHFHKEWHVAGRWFLGWLTRRQQLLPKRLKMTMWDADTDSLELGIDLLSPSWDATEKAAFLGEFPSAAEAAEAALTKPLLQKIHAARRAVWRSGQHGPGTAKWV